MSTATLSTPPRRRPRQTATAAFSLLPASLDAVQALVDKGVYANKSHAVDAALVLLIAQHRDELDSDGDV